MRHQLTDQNLAEGARYLKRCDARFEPLFARVEPLNYRAKPQGFSGLLQSIVSQQLSTRAARTIWERVQASGPITEQRILDAPDHQLRAMGLSHQKIRYAKALAGAGIDFEALNRMTTEEVIATLVPVVGIGEWTAQIYALFALGHTDVFASNDLGLQEGIRKWMGWSQRPTPKMVDEISDPWSPWRSVAALALWRWHDLNP